MKERGGWGSKEGLMEADLGEAELSMREGWVAEAEAEGEWLGGWGRG